MIILVQIVEFYDIKVSAYNMLMTYNFILMGWERNSSNSVFLALISKVRSQHSSKQYTAKNRCQHGPQLKKTKQIKSLNQHTTTLKD